MNNIGELAALGTAICWSLSATSFEIAGKKVGSLAVNYLRLILGFIFISIFTFVTSGNFLPVNAGSSSWILLSISGLIGLFIGDLFLVQSYLEIGSRISMLVMAASPPITAILSYFIFGEHIGWSGVLGMSVTMGGIAMVILGRDAGAKKIKLTHSVKGLTFAFLGALGQSVGLLFSKMGMGANSPFAATQIRIITGIISFALLITFTRKWGDVKKALTNKGAMTGITIGSIFGPFVGVSLSLMSLQYVSAGISATITSIVPVTIIPISILLFKEKIKPKEALGAVITVFGVAMLFLL